MRIIDAAIKKFYLSCKKNLKNLKKINDLKKKIESKKIKVEYLEARNKMNFSKKIKKSNFKIFISFYVNNIRLIDNI